MFDRKWIVGFCLLSTLSVTAWAGNIYYPKDGKIYCLGRVELWAYGGMDWRTLPTNELELKEVLKHGAELGFNGIALDLQTPEQKIAFFAPDGKAANPDRARQLTQLCAAVRNHYTGTWINLFNADPKAYLADADAYRQATRTVAALLPQRHSAIVILGDVFSGKSWREDCPYDMTDPDKLIALAQIINETREDCLVALPAQMVNPQADHDFLYITNKADELRLFVKEIRQNTPADKRTANVVAIPRDRLRLLDADTRLQGHYLRKFGGDVRSKRLAAHYDPPHNDQGPTARLSDEEKEAGFKLLFDGHSLKQWTTLTPDWGSWQVVDGTIYNKGTHTAWLRTRETFRDFILRLEFRIEKEGNSGIFFRSPLDGRASRFGFECQIYGEQQDPPKPDYTTGAIYGAVTPPIDATNPPGQWNAVEIACRGTHIVVKVNGQTVQDIDALDHAETKGNLREGLIGLQDHGNEVAFRNIRIKTLNTSTTKESH